MIPVLGVFVDRFGPASGTPRGILERGGCTPDKALH